MRRIFLLIIAAMVLASHDGVDARQQRELSRERAVLQTDFGDIHLAFYPTIAPRTVELILALFELGCYNTNHFFRVDKGFVAQIADVQNGRQAPMDELQQKWASKTVPLEVHEDVKHDRVGILSLARHDDPNSGGSSFSILLGPAPHLNMQYTIFGQVTKGIETLESLQQVETVTEGIFVMPKTRIHIHSTYVLYSDSSLRCSESVELVETRLNSTLWSLERLRETSLPGH